MSEYFSSTTNVIIYNQSDIYSCKMPENEMFSKLKVAKKSTTLLAKGILNLTQGQYSFHRSRFTILALQDCFYNFNRLPHNTATCRRSRWISGCNRPVQRHMGKAGPSAHPGEYAFLCQCGTGYEAQITWPVVGRLRLEPRSWIWDFCSVKTQETGWLGQSRGAQ